MLSRLASLKNFLLDLFFPSFCLNCQKEGDYLCQDCFSLIDIANQSFCPFCHFRKIVLDGKTCPVCRKNKKLTGLFSATSYYNFIIKKIISQFKYEPYIKELAKPLSLLIIQHFQLLDYSPPFFRDKTGFIFMPIPLHKKRLKWRGFNQAEEIARHLSLFFKIPLISDVLLKAKENQPQMELTAEARQENIKGVFTCRNESLVKNKNLAFGKNFVFSLPLKNKNLRLAQNLVSSLPLRNKNLRLAQNLVSSLPLRNKKILLVDDVFTTGATMEECARVLKNSGAKEVWGIVAARE